MNNAQTLKTVILSLKNFWAKNPVFATKLLDSSPKIKHWVQNDGGGKFNAKK